MDVDEEMTLAISLPLDSEGFLRRECPTCDREFKWLHSSAENERTEAIADGGYFCPYCGVQAPANAWLTQAQVSLVQNTAHAEILGPILKKFGQDIEGIARGSGGIISARANYNEPEKLDPLTESDDMKRVDFECHPAEPLKVLDDWSNSVHCLICGEVSP